MAYIDVSIPGNVVYVGKGGQIANFSISGAPEGSTLKLTIGTTTKNMTRYGNLAVEPVASQITFDLWNPAVAFEALQNQTSSAMIYYADLLDKDGKLLWRGNKHNGTITIVSGYQTPVINYDATAKQFRETEEGILSLTANPYLFVQSSSVIEFRMPTMSPNSWTDPEKAYVTVNYGASYVERLPYSDPSSNMTVILDLRNKPALKGTIPIYLRLYDSRGVYTQVIYYLVVNAYNPPIITAFGVNRDPAIESTFLVSKSISITNLLDSDGVNVNNYSVVLRYKRYGTNYWVNANVENNSSIDYKLTDMAVDSSYTFELIVSDLLNSSTSTASLSTVKTLLDFYKDIGIGIGKIFESGSDRLIDVGGNMNVDGKIDIGDALNVQGKTTLNGDIVLGGYVSTVGSANVGAHLSVGKTLSVSEDMWVGGKKLIDIFYPIGSIFTSTSSTSPAETMGGTWVEFARGRTLVGYSSGDTWFGTLEKTGGAVSQELRAAIGAVNGNTSALGYIPYNPIKGYYGTYHANYGPVGASNVGKVNSTNHSIGVFTPDGGWASTLQPYQVVKYWKRTA